MKKTYTVNALIIILLLLIMNSCKSNHHNKIPAVINPTYSIYNFSGEKGYNVSFSLSYKSEPIYLIINKIKKPITPENKDGSIYKINVISETKKIENYKIEGSPQENGIIFKVKNKEIFKPVHFELK